VHQQGFIFKAPAGGVIRIDLLEESFFLEIFETQYFAVNTGDANLILGPAQNPLSQSLDMIFVHSTSKEKLARRPNPTKVRPGLLELSS
jgi:hypothetical protein